VTEATDYHVGIDPLDLKHIGPVDEIGTYRDAAKEWLRTERTTLDTTPCEVYVVRGPAPDGGLDVEWESDESVASFRANCRGLLGPAYREENYSDLQA